MLDILDMKRFIKYCTQEEAEVLASKLISIVVNSNFSKLFNYDNNDDIMIVVLDFIKEVAIIKEDYIANYEAERKEVE
jgi:hypothetical protein